MLKKTSTVERKLGLTARGAGATTIKPYIATQGRTRKEKNCRRYLRSPGLNVRLTIQPREIRLLRKK